MFLYFDILTRSPTLNLESLSLISLLVLMYVLPLTSIGLTVCYYHVTYAFQSESTLYSCLNVKELLARSRREI